MTARSRSAPSRRELCYGVAQARTAGHPRAEAIARGVDAILDAFEGRILPIDAPAAKAWATLLSRQNKHVDDKCLVALALVNHLTLVTRNVRHVTGYGIDVLDPFKQPAEMHPGSASAG